ncbi:hypothetical protein [Mangrovibacterium lignilyticum]|uniref:hypothetical protein n=1 Tax=Mangrovibacterium lignilyticum TaxID=2668052 RepID=UPI0013D4F048|nr:hypothetical protein [Mangrovibacterium lignilyticum]
MKKIYWLLSVVLILGACSSGQKALDQGNFKEAISKAVNRLSQDPNNRKAQQVVADGYPMAMQYYQEEIDQTLAGNDPFKWNRTLAVMQQVNGISETIRRIPAARKIIPSPKIYTSELDDVFQRAAEEHYAAGMASLDRQTRDDAKQACRNFRECDRLVPGYKDVLQQMNEAKELATLRVIVEPLPAPSMNYELTADFFYSQLMERMNQLYPSESFVNFFTPQEAEKINLKYPDMVVNLAFMDFYIERPKHYEEEQNLNREIEEEVKVKVSRDSVRTEKRLVKVKGKIRVITDEVASGGLIKVRVNEFQANKLLLDNNIPGEFLWRNQYGIFIGDERVLTKEEVRILNNQAVPPPGPQDMFLEFTKPIYSRLTDQMHNFFRRYN